MGKRPSFQFYPNDWLGDNNLQMATTTTKGVWIQILCRMWWSVDRGKIEGTREQIAGLAGCKLDEFEEFLRENASLNFACVTEHDKIVTVLNRRMEREERARKSNASRQSRFRHKHSNEEVTVPSSSPSPFPKKNIKKKPVGSGDPPGFNLLWAAYVGPKGPKQDAIKAFREVCPPENVVELLVKQIQYKQACDRLGVFCSPFPHVFRWLRKRRWEDEVPELPKGNGKGKGIAQSRPLREAYTCTLCGEIHEVLVDQPHVCPKTPELFGTPKPSETTH